MTNSGERKETRCSDRATKCKKMSGELALTNKGYERHHVKHNLHDYARVVSVTNPLQVELEAKASGGVNNPFPTILHKLLSETDILGFSDIISWQPHGRSFLIHKPKEFANDVVPRYFKHSKLSSFQRQLSLYGFVRLTNESPDKGSYYHELFLRGRTFLCSKIQRTRVKGTWVRTSSSPESEPDFFSMDPVPDPKEIVATGQTTNYISPKLSPVVSDAGDSRSQVTSSSTIEPCFDIDAPIEKDQPQADTAFSTGAYASPVPNIALHLPSELPGGCYSLPTPDDNNTPQILSLPEQSDGFSLDTRELPLFQQKWYSCDVPSLTSLSRAISCQPLFEDDELGSFLHDLDLGLELEKAESLIQTATMI